MWINQKNKLSGLHNGMLPHVTSIPVLRQLEMKILEIVLIHREIVHQKDAGFFGEQLFL